MNRKIKLLACIIFSGAVTTAVAGIGNGVYVGAGFDYGWTSFDFTATGQTTGRVISRTVNDDNGLGHLFVGYGHLFNCYYLGAELGTYFPSFSETFSRRGVTLINNAFTNKFTLQNYATLDLTPGVLIHNNVLAYARVGVAYSQIKIQQFPTDVTTEFNDSTNKPGLRLGLGADYAITDRVSMGVDYIYTMYQKFNTAFTRFNTGFSLTPDTQQVGVHVEYHFG